MEHDIALRAKHIGDIHAQAVTLDVEQEVFAVYVPDATAQHRRAGNYSWSVDFDIPATVKMPKGWRGQAFEIAIETENDEGQHITYTGYVKLWRRKGKHRGCGALTRTVESKQAVA